MFIHISNIARSRLHCDTVVSLDCLFWCRYDMTWNYDYIYSWQLGREINGLSLTLSDSL